MREVQGRNLSLAPTFGAKVSLKAFYPLKSGGLSATTVALRLVQTTHNSHCGFLAPWATKPTNEIRRSSAKALQQEEKHKDVGFGLTGEGKEIGPDLLALGSVRLQTRLKRTVAQTHTKILT